MVKRKVSSTDTGNNNSTKKVKKSSQSDQQTKNEEVKSNIEFSTGDKVMMSLLGSDITLEKFFDEYWEKKHFVVKRKKEDYYGDLFSLDAMKAILKDHEINFETDVNVCRYVENEKELLNEDGQITVEKCEELIKDKSATFQMHQPQRYSDVLWKLMEKMESYFGCLVGSNVYITSKESQGLAPHCDDVEVFILQLEGKKDWKLYKPMVELSRDYTQDLSQDSIGEPILEVTLEPGDLLYFPRGTIHQAKACGAQHSTHITLSTYQHNTIGDFMNVAISQGIENALDNDVNFRTGLPINFLSYLGTEKNSSEYISMEGENASKLTSNKDNMKVKKFKESIKVHLAKLIDHIDVNTAADALSKDFMGSRLPPFGHIVKEDDEDDDCDVKAPTLESSIKLRYPEHVRMVYNNEDENDDENDDMTIDEEEDDDDGEEGEDEEKPAAASAPGCEKTSTCCKKSSCGSLKDADDEDADEVPEDEPCLVILHSLNNDRMSHMCGEEFMTPVSLKFPVHFATAIASVLEGKDFIKVSELPLEEDDDKLQLATSLFSDDLILIK